jgi:hypothetical protein
MICFDQFNFTSQACGTIADAYNSQFEKKCLVLELVYTSPFMLLLLEYLNYFWRLPIVPFACANLLSWCQSHENQFQNVGYLIKHILGILGSQIKT